jgi:hypothetical protein
MNFGEALAIKQKQMVEVFVNSSTIKWYESKGYSIPRRLVQQYCKDSNGNRIKNGFRLRFRKGTKIMVDIKDMAPQSNVLMSFRCSVCGGNSTTMVKSYIIKKYPDTCNGCIKKLIKKGTGSHGYWVIKLIDTNDNAKCDISGETDKRFLVLHHLLNRRSGGKNEESNYVVLSANYHLAFHVWNGGLDKPCIPDQYYRFKDEEFMNNPCLQKIGK